MGLFNMFSGGETKVDTPDTIEEDIQNPEGLDKYQDMLYNSDNKEKDPNAPGEPSPVFDPVQVLNNPEAIEELMGKLDFTTAITKETQAKLAEQAPDGISSLVNDVSKAAYLQALQHSSALSKQHISDALDNLRSETGQTIKSSIGDYELKQALPEISNPIVQLGVDQFITKLREQNPTMIGADIATEVRGYLKDLNAAMNPTAPTPEEKAKSKEVDWADDLGLNW